MGRAANSPSTQAGFHRLEVRQKRRDPAVTAIRGVLVVTVVISPAILQVLGVRIGRVRVPEVISQEPVMRERLQGNRMVPRRLPAEKLLSEDVLLAKHETAQSRWGAGSCVAAAPSPESGGRAAI